MSSVLILEDEISYGLELEILAKELGYESIHFNDSISLTKHVLEHGADFLLLDIHLSNGKTSFELMEVIWELSIPTIFITGSPDPLLYQRSKEWLHSAFLSKPVSKYTLKSTMEL